jgi:hypothetical protein
MVKQKQKESGAAKLKLEKPIQIWQCELVIEKIMNSMIKYIANKVGTIKLPFEEGLLEWLHTQYPYSKYHVVELNNEMAFEFS